MEGACIQVYLALSVVILASQCDGLVESDKRPGVIVKPSPSVLVVHKRSSLLLNCSAVSEPDYAPITYSWIKNGKPFSTSKRVQMLTENGSLYFQHIKRKKRMNDEGTYVCLMRNSKGTVIGREVQLKVARISRSFNKEPHDQQAVVGGVARFECNINATTSPIYVWHRDDEVLHSNDRVTKLPSGVLQIHNVQPEDAGLYSCSVSYSFQGSHASRPTVHWRNSDDGTLKVIQDDRPRPPTIVSFKEEVNVTAKETVTLECLVDGNPRPTVEWFKEELSPIDGKTIVTPVIMDVLKVLRGYSNLEFKEVDVYDDGIYHCVASSGGQEAKVVITLHVNEPPALVLFSPKSVTVDIARRVRLPCVVQGRPKPEVSWYHNSKEIHANGHFNIANNNELRIESTYEDTGYYQCIARNSVGYAIATAHVKVNKQVHAPDPPQNLTIKVLSSHEVYIHWSSSRLPENCDCEIVAYTVHAREVNPESKYKTEIVTNTSFRLNGLHPFTEYEFYVTAYTREGASRASDKKRAVTKQGIPDAAPEVTLKNVDPNTVSLSWEPLPLKNRNGVISKYKIQYKTKDVPLFSEEVSGDVNTFLLQGLSANTTYSIMVVAGTSIGYPNNQDWVWKDHTTMYMNGTVEPPPNIDIKVTAVTSTTAHIEWSATNLTRPITGYKIMIFKYSDKNKSVSQRVFDRDTTSFEITGLEDKTFYIVTVTIENSEVTLQKKSKLFQTYDPGTKPLPAPPDDIMCTPLTSSAINVSWRRTDNEDILYYVVQYRKVQASHVFMQRSDSLNLLLENLEPFTRYLISVRSYTQDSHGPYSLPVTVSTKEGVPSAPRGFSVKTITKDEVILRWEPPSHINGVIVSYIVMYNLQKEEPDDLWKSLKQNGSSTSIIVRDLTDDTYYFKLKACTKAGQGPTSQTIQVMLHDCDFNCTPKDPELAQKEPVTVHDQKLGIIVGCSVGLASIVICVLVVVLRQRHYAPLAQHHHSNMNHIHSNGHAGGQCGQVVSNGHAGGQVVNNETMYRNYPSLENHVTSETNGPTNGVLLSGNGKIVYFCNGGTTNGRIRAFIAEPYDRSETPEMAERKALLATESIESQNTADDQPTESPDLNISVDSSYSCSHSTTENSSRGDNSCLENPNSHGNKQTYNYSSSAELDNNSTSESLKEGKNGVPHEKDGASVTSICSGSHDGSGQHSCCHGNLNSGNDTNGENSCEEDCHGKTNSGGRQSISNLDNLLQGDNSLTSDELLKRMLDATSANDYSANSDDLADIINVPAVKNSGVNKSLPRNIRARSRSPGSRSSSSVIASDDSTNSVET